jgi:uncharacterized protein (TIGR00251 family)
MVSDSPRPIPSYLSDAGQDCLLSVRVIPRAGRTSLAGKRGASLLVRVAAAPVDGAANGALLAFLAEHLGVPPRALSLEAGMRSRDKRIRITNRTAADVAARLQDT